MLMVFIGSAWWGNGRKALQGQVNGTQQCLDWYYEHGQGTPPGGCDPGTGWDPGCEPSGGSCFYGLGIGCIADFTNNGSSCTQQNTNQCITITGSTCSNGRCIGGTVTNKPIGSSCSNFTYGGGDSECTNAGTCNSGGCFPKPANQCGAWTNDYAGDAGVCSGATCVPADQAPSCQPSQPICGDNSCDTSEEEDACSCPSDCDPNGQDEKEQAQCTCKQMMKNAQDWPEDQRPQAACEQIGANRFENPDAEPGKQGKYCTSGCQVSECSDKEDNEEFPDGTRGDVAFYSTFGMSGKDDGDFGCFEDSGGKTVKYDPKRDSEVDDYNNNQIPTLQITEWGNQSAVASAGNWFWDFLASIVNVDMGAKSLNEIRRDEKLCSGVIVVVEKKIELDNYNNYYMDAKKVACADTRPSGTSTQKGGTPPPPDAVGAISLNCHENCRENAIKMMTDAGVGVGGGGTNPDVREVLEEWCVSACFCGTSTQSVVDDITKSNADCKKKSDHTIKF